MHTSPHIAVLLNITPNHLDRHKTMQAYTDAKANILTHQETSDWAVLNREDVGSFQLKEKVVGNLSTFGVEKPEIGVAGTFLDGDMIMSFGGKQSLPIMNRKSLKLIGAHNVKNALAASAAAVIAGFSHKAIAKGISHVNGIPHRLEFVREYKGIRWINDSIATAPERVIAALKSISGPLVLLLGGRDKKLPWTDLAREIHIRKPVILVFGEAGPMIKEKLRRFEDNKPQYKIIPCRDLEDAIFKALSFTTQVDTVLLSPGCTSYDEFFDFEERGNYFKKVIGEFK